MKLLLDGHVSLWLRHRLHFARGAADVVWISVFILLVLHCGEVSVLDSFLKLLFFVLVFLHL